MEPGAATLSAAAAEETAQWFRNRQKTRATVLETAPRGAPLSTPKFEGACDGLKGLGLVFYLAYPRADPFTRVEPNIAKYISK